MNKYPVVFISLKEIYGEESDSILANLKLAVSELCKQYPELNRDESLEEEDRKILGKLRDQEANEANTIASLGFLARLLKNYYKKQTFVIIDEYDVPMAKAMGIPEYDRVRDTIDCTVNVNLPYHRIHDSGENLWSALVETGYLSKAVTENMPLMPLRIPNKEIQVVFREEIWNYFKDKIDNVHGKKCLIDGAVRFYKGIKL